MSVAVRGGCICEPPRRCDGDGAEPSPSVRSGARVHRAGPENVARSHVEAPDTASGIPCSGDMNSLFQFPVPRGRTTAKALLLNTFRHSPASPLFAIRESLCTCPIGSRSPRTAWTCPIDWRRARRSSMAWTRVMVVSPRSGEESPTMKCVHSVAASLGRKTEITTH